MHHLAGRVQERFACDYRLLPSSASLCEALKAVFVPLDTNSGAAELKAGMQASLAYNRPVL